MLRPIQPGTERPKKWEELTEGEWRTHFAELNNTLAPAFRIPGMACDIDVAHLERCIAQAERMIAKEKAGQDELGRKDAEIAEIEQMAREGKLSPQAAHGALEAARAERARIQRDLVEQWRSATGLPPAQAIEAFRLAIARKEQAEAERGSARSAARR